MVPVKEKFRDTRVILASRSPRRQLLLGGLGIRFDVIDNAGIDETYPAFLEENEIPVYLAFKKSDAHEALLKENTLLITADTIVCCGNRVLDKPSGREEAVEMLKLLSGRKHHVISGVCLRSRSKTVSFSSATAVFFRDLTDEEIIYYVDNYKPYDKAGAYGIQEWIGYTGIRKINGSYYNVMGLPVDKLYENLAGF